jgi:hypothetical protein
MPEHAAMVKNQVGNPHAMCRAVERLWEAVALPGEYPRISQ